MLALPPAAPTSFHGAPRPRPHSKKRRYTFQLAATGGAATSPADTEPMADAASQQQQQQQKQGARYMAQYPLRLHGLHASACIS